MKSLTSSLTAHQVRVRRVPAVSAIAYAERGGLPLLAWEQWYTGTENDTAAACTVSSSGTLHRLRNQGGNCYYSRVAPPVTSSSTFSSWTSLGTDIVGNTGVAIAAAGTTLIVLWVKTGSRRLRFRKSTDDGVTWSAAADMVASDEAADIQSTAVALIDGNTGHAFYAVGATLRRCPYASGAWGTRANATPTFTQINESGLQAIYSANDTCYYLALAGLEATTSNHLVQVIRFRTVPSVQWSAGTPALYAPFTGTMVFARHPSVAQVVDAGGNTTLLCSWTERESIPIAYTRTFLARAPYAAAYVPDTTMSWSEPEPHRSTKGYGGHLATDGTLRWYVCTASEVWAADAPAAPGAGFELGGLVVSARLQQRDAACSGELVFDDANGWYDPATSRLRPGGELQLRCGYESGTAGAAEYGTAWRLRVLGISRRLTRAGQRQLVVKVGGPWEWGATVRTRMGYASPPSTGRGYQWQHALNRLSWSADITIPGSVWVTHQPALILPPGGSWAALTRSVFTPEAYLQRLDGRTVVAVLCDPTDTPVATYGDTGAGEAPVLELELPDELPEVNWSRVQGDQIYADAFDLDSVSLHGPRLQLTREWDATTGPKIQEYTATTLARTRQERVLARATIPWDAGLELGDVVTVEDARLVGTVVTGRVVRLSLTYDRSNTRTGPGRYDASLDLANP